MNETGCIEPRYRDVGSYTSLNERGTALTFEIDQQNFVSGFIIKYQGSVYGYRNQCPHTGSPLDWAAGRFFDTTGERIICATHGAQFDPVNGLCLAGPCVNQRLISIPLRLDGDRIMAFY